MKNTQYLCVVFTHKYFYMKKVIVFRVEEVLVKGNDENRLEEMRGRVFVKRV